VRAILSVFASCLLFVFVASTTEKGTSGQQAIKEILGGTKRWTFIFEFTPENLPTDRASSTEFEFFWRGSEFVGRTTKFVGGSNCEFNLTIRDDGFDFQRCGGFGEASVASLDYYPDDKAYPFKRLNAPQKLWLAPKQK